MTQRIEELRQTAIRKKQHFDTCELFKNRNPYDVKGVEFYKKVEKMDIDELRLKLEGCYSTITHIDHIKDYFLEKYVPTHIRTGIRYNRDDWEKMEHKLREEIAEKTCNGLFNSDINKLDSNLEEYIKKGVSTVKTDLEKSDIYFTEEEIKHDYLGEYKNSYFPIFDDNKNFSQWITHTVLGYKPYSIFELRDACEIVKDTQAERPKKCQIVNDNGLILHYVINERSDNIDVKTGLMMRDIEKRCIGFPMIKDIPYIRNGKEVFRFRVKVTKDPDSSGRVGRIDIVVVKPEESLVGIETEHIYDELRDIEKRNVLNLVLGTDMVLWGTGFRHARSFDEHDKRVQKKILENRAIVLKLWNKGNTGTRTIGGETCVWAASTKPLGVQEAEAEKLLTKDYEGMDLAERIQFFEDQLNNLDRLEGGLVDAFPRQTLFNQTVSTMAGWVDFELAPNDPFGNPLVDPLLANMLYQHIVQVDPSLLSRHFVKLVKSQAIRQAEQIKSGAIHPQDVKNQWNWIIAWVKKFNQVEYSLTYEDLVQVHDIVKLPLNDIFDANLIIDIVKTQENKYTLVELIDKYFALFNQISPFGAIMKSMENPEFSEIWHEYFAPINIISTTTSFDSAVNRSAVYKQQAEWIEHELYLKNKSWQDSSVFEQLIKNWIVDRDNDNIKAEKTKIGIFKAWSLSEDSTGAMAYMVTDHFGTSFSGWYSQSPLDELCDLHQYDRDWAELPVLEKMRFAAKIDNISVRELFGSPDKSKTLELPPEGESFFDDYFHAYSLSRCPFWNDANEEWDREAIMDFLLENYDSLINWREASVKYKIT